MKPIPLEILAVLTEGAESVQGAANDFGLLIDCTIRIKGEHGSPDLLLRYSVDDTDNAATAIEYERSGPPLTGWSVEVVPKEAIRE